MALLTSIAADQIGVDYSFSKPSAANLKAQGVRFASRYLSHDARKNLSPTERDELHANGIGILLNWELYGTRPYSEIDDAAVGRLDGTEAATQARALGYPAGATIYFSVDTDITTQWPEVLAYLTGAEASVKAAGYRAGTYGEYDLIERCSAIGLCTGGYWQSFAWSPRGPGLQGVRQHPLAHFFQLLGLDRLTGLIGAVDENRTLRPTTVWLPNTQPDPTPPVITEDTMPKLIAYADDPATIYLTEMSSAGLCLFVVPASGGAINAWRFLTGPYPDPSDTNPWGVQIVEAAARANHVRLPYTPGGSFYSDIAAVALGPKGDKGDRGLDGARGSQGIPGSPAIVTRAAIVAAIT